MKPSMEKMTLREKIAQTVLVGQHELIQKKQGNGYIERGIDEIKELVKKNQYTGLYIMGNQQKIYQEIRGESYGSQRPNSDTLRQWVKEISKELKIPFICGMDAEVGGGGSFSDMTFTCKPQTVGAASSAELAYQLSQCIGKEIKSAGVNWRWAPMYDVASRYSWVMSTRICSDSEDVMYPMNEAIIKGTQSVGVAATAKHFPGGDLYEYRDSHIVPSMLGCSMEEWRNLQAKRFRVAIDTGVYSIMVSHEAFPAADDTKVNGNYLPSTLSKKIVTGLLKEELGFDGVVITDSLLMGGLTSIYPYEQMIVELIKAGNDVLLAARLDSVDILEKAVLSGEIPEERIDDACRRVLNMKEKLGLFDEDYQMTYPLTPDMVAETKRVNLELSEKSMTLLRDKNGRLPLQKENIKKVAIICSSHTDTFHVALSTLKEEFEKRGASVHMQRRLGSREELADIAATNDLIIYAAYLAPHQPMGALSFYGDEAATFMYAFAYGKEKSIGISFAHPYIHYDFMPDSDMFINAYNDSAEAQQAVVKALYGEIGFEGKSPVDLTPKNR